MTHSASFDKIGDLLPGNNPRHSVVLFVIVVSSVRKKLC
jgi:hypothetical protein